MNSATIERVTKAESDFATAGREFTHLTKHRMIS